MRKLNIAVFVLALLGALDFAEGQTLFVRGRRGPIVPNNSSRLSNPTTVRGAPNLVFAGGKVFERQPNGKINGLAIDMRTGRLLGARDPRTAGQLSAVLSRMQGRFTGRAKEAIDTFIRANPPQLAQDNSITPPVSNPTGGGAPVVGGGSVDPRGRGRTAVADPKDGKHGQGTGTDTTPKGLPPAGKSTSSRPVAGGPPAETPGGACSNLSSALCANDANRQNKERQADDLKRSTVVSFLKQANLDGRGFGQILGGILQDPRRFGAAYQAFTNFVSGQMGQEAKAAIASARTALLTSIEGQSLSPENKAAVRARLTGVRFRFAPNFGSFESIRAFVENCGPEGMGDGAFAIPTLNEVVICPGLVLGGKGKGGSLESHLTHVLAHEMGHHCGADPVPGSRTGFGPFKPIYARMEQCYLSKFAGLGQERLGEVAADTWGVEALAVQLRGKSRGEAFSFLQNALAPLCGSSASPEHPPGSFRIDITLGRNPRIREALGCGAPTAERPACTLAGKIPAE